MTDTEKAIEEVRVAKEALARAEKALEQIKKPKRYDVKEETPIDEDGDIIFNDSKQLLGIDCGCYAVLSSASNNKWENAYKDFQWEACEVKDLVDGNTVYLNSSSSSSSSSSVLPTRFNTHTCVAKYINGSMYQAINNNNLITIFDYMADTAYKLVPKDK